MKGNQVPLTTIYPSQSQTLPPSDVSIDDCSVICTKLIPPMIQGYYGTQGKSGCAAAGQTTIINGQTPHLVTIAVDLELPLPKETARPSNLSNTQFVNVMRASRDMIDFLADFWHAGLKKKGLDAQLATMDWSVPSRFIPGHEDLIVDLMNLPEWRHVKVVVYPSAPKTGLHVPVSWFMTGAVRREDISSAFFTFDQDRKLRV